MVLLLTPAGSSIIGLNRNLLLCMWRRRSPGSSAVITSCSFGSVIFRSPPVELRISSGPPPGVLRFPSKLSPSAGALVPWCPRWRTPGHPLVFGESICGRYFGGLNKNGMETWFLNHVFLWSLSVLLLDLGLPGPLWAGTPGYNRTTPITDGFYSSADTDGPSSTENGVTSTSYSSESLSPSQRDLLLTHTAETHTGTTRSLGKIARIRGLVDKMFTLRSVKLSPWLSQCLVQNVLEDAAVKFVFYPGWVWELVVDVLIPLFKL